MQRPGFLKQTTFAGLLLALISLAIPLFAQQQKPPNPQLPDPNQTQQQPPASTHIFLIIRRETRDTAEMRRRRREQLRWTDLQYMGEHR